MPVLSHLHQLFNAEQCQAYIHTLRWKDRLLRCKRTFNDLTHTLLHQSQRPLAYWILATFLLCLACSSRRIALEVGVHIRTSYR
jgi:hypothetical protein